MGNFYLVALVKQFYLDMMLQHSSNSLNEQAYLVLQEYAMKNLKCHIKLT